MKKTTKLLSVILALAILLSIPINALAFSTSNLFTSSKITHQSRFADSALYQGVDISYHNGKVDWVKMKAAGVRFVILRAGFRTYRSEGYIKQDEQFENYIKAAHAAGLKIGIYFYSQAKSVAEATEEANFTLNVINPYKQYIDLPVAYDYEFAGVSSGRLDSAFKSWKAAGTHKSIMTANCEAFCDTIKNAGYDPMIYASKSFFEDNLYYTTLEKKYTIWLAHYTTNTNYKGKYNFWQFSSTGKISGVSGYVDSNFLYTTAETQEIPDQEYTGSPIEPEVTVTDGIRTLVKDKDYTVTYSNNINYGIANAEVNGLGDYADDLKKTLHFTILPQTVRNLTLTDTGNGKITLSWTQTQDADGYQIESVDRDDVTVLADLGSKKSSYEYQLPEGTAVNCFRVRAYKNLAGVKTYGHCSDSVMLTRQVQGLTTVKRTKSTIKLQWQHLGNAAKYYVYCYSSKEKKWEHIGTTAKVRYNVKNLAANTKYKFLIKAVFEAEDGTLSVGKASPKHKSYTVPNTTILKTAQAQKRRKIKLNWLKISGVSGYEVMWSTSSNFKKNTKTELFSGASKVTRTITAAQANKTYYVRVRTFKTRSGVRYYSSWSKKLKVKTKK